MSDKSSKEFQQIEIESIPEDWEVVRLGEIFEETKVKVKDIGEYNIPILSITRHQGLILQSEKFKKKVASRDISNYKVVRNGDMVYGFPMEEGVIHFLWRFKIGAVSPTYYVWRVKVDKADKVNKRFLDYYLKIPKMIKIYSMLTTKTVHRRKIVSPRDFRQISIPLPPLPEQQKIAKVLDKIQQAIEIQDRIIEQTKKLKKSLMQKLFTEGLYGEEQKETKIGLIPKSWEVVRFEDAILKNRYKVGKIKQQDYKEFGKYPVIDQSQNYSAGFSDDDGKVYQGPLPVIIFGDHTRIFKFVDFPFIVGADGVKIIIPNIALYDPRFLYFAFLAMDIPSRGYNRHYPLLREREIPLPPLEEQKEIAHILSVVDKKIEIEQRRKEVLKQLFKTMLHKLMSGEIRLKNVEI